MRWRKADAEYRQRASAYHCAMAASRGKKFGSLGSSCGPIPPSRLVPKHRPSFGWTGAIWTSYRISTSVTQGSRPYRVEYGRMGRDRMSENRQCSNRAPADLGRAVTDPSFWAGGAVGAVVSSLAFSVGIEGGPAWPSIVAAAPAATLSMWIFRGGFVYFCGYVLGTAIEYGALGYLLRTWNTRLLRWMFCVHVASADTWHGWPRNSAIHDHSSPPLVCASRFEQSCSSRRRSSPARLLRRMPSRANRNRVRLPKRSSRASRSIRCRVRVSR